MKLSSELIDKIVENIRNNEDNLYHFVVDIEIRKFYDYEFEVDGLNIYVEVDISNLQNKQHYFKRPYPEPSEDFCHFSFDYDVVKVVVNESEEADEESINALNNKLQGHIEQETSILLWNEKT